MKKILFTAIILASMSISAQVGVGNTDPKATLDVTADAATATTADGIIAPRLTGNQLADKDAVYIADQTAAQVYVTAAATSPEGKTVNVTAPGYYYFDGNVWQKVATGAGSTEWAYNNTNASIEATRAKLNGGINSILDSNGATYKNLGNYDWTTILSANGDPAYSGDPKASALSTEFYTSAALPTTTTLYTTGTAGTWNFGAKEYVLKEAHVGGASTFLTKNYNYEKKGVYIDGVTSPIGINVLSNELYTITANTTANSTAHLMTQQTLEFYGTGSGGSLTGVSTRIRNRGTGSTTGMIGLSSAIQNDATTGNTTTMRAINASVLHSSTAGTVTNTSGVNTTNSIAAGATIPTSSTGIHSTLVNSSTQINAGSTDMQGINSTVTNNGANKFTTLRGLNLTTTNGTAAGAFINGNGINNAFINNATSTDPITTFYGINTLLRNAGGSTIGNMTGNNIATEVTATATAGIPTTMYGTSNSTKLQSTATGTTTTLMGINNQVTKSGNANVTNGYADYNLLSITGAGLTPNVYGSFIRLANGSTNTGTVVKASGLELSNVLSGANNVTDNFGLNINTGTFTGSTGNITNNYGIYVLSNKIGTGSIDNNYGLYLSPIAGGTTNNYSIYSNGGNSYFKDNVGIGTTTPTSKLQVVGLPVHAHNAAAITAGLTAGAFYHAGDGIVRVVF